MLESLPRKLSFLLPALPPVAVCKVNALFKMRSLPDDHPPGLRVSVQPRVTLSCSTGWGRRQRMAGLKEERGTSALACGCPCTRPAQFSILTTHSRKKDQFPSMAAPFRRSFPL